MKKKYIRNEDPCIEWLENNFNSYDLFYFTSSEGTNIINCYFKSDNSLYCTFYRSLIKRILESYS